MTVTVTATVVGGVEVGVVACAGVGVVGGVAVIAIGDAAAVPTGVPAETFAITVTLAEPTGDATAAAGEPMMTGAPCAPVRTVLCDVTTSSRTDETSLVRPIRKRSYTMPAVKAVPGALTTIGPWSPDSAT